jgi:hypothetical protein
MLRVVRPSGWLVLLVTAACGGGSKSAATPGGPAPVQVTQVVALSELYLLELSGAPPLDTTFALKPGVARTVIVRHAPPDNNTFAELQFPASVFAADSAVDSVHLTVKAKPRVYGLTLESDRPLGHGARITFKYPVHFQAPQAATSRYGNALAFEAAMLVAAEQEDGRYGLLVSSRPASDNLSAPMPRAGTYYAAAPR